MRLRRITCLKYLWSSLKLRLNNSFNSFFTEIMAIMRLNLEEDRNEKLLYALVSSKFLASMQFQIKFLDLLLLRSRWLSINAKFNCYSACVYILLGSPCVCIDKDLKSWRLRLEIHRKAFTTCPNFRHRGHQWLVRLFYFDFSNSIFILTSAVLLIPILFAGLPEYESYISKNLGLFESLNELHRNTHFQIEKLKISVSHRIINWANYRRV